MSARFSPTRDPAGYIYSLTYDGTPGEANDVVIAHEGDTTRIADAGAPIEIASERCTAVSPHEAVCQASGLPDVRLGDRDDALVGPRGTFHGGEGNDRLHAALFLDGGHGDDVLTGSGGGDDMSGGGGRDELHAKGGNDLLTDGDDITRGVGPDVLAGGSGSDLASYRDRTGPVAVDLRLASGQGQFGEGDTFTSIEEVTTGRSSEPARLTGDAGANVLTAFAHRSVLRGHGGNDDLAAWSSYRDVMSGGAGDDRLDVEGEPAFEPDALACGRGRDVVFMGHTPAQYVPPDCERVLTDKDFDDFPPVYRLLGVLRVPEAAVARVIYGRCYEPRCNLVWAAREQAGNGRGSRGPLLIRREQRVRRGKAPRVALKLTPRGRSVLRRRRSIRARIGFLRDGRVVGGFVVELALARARNVAEP